MKGTAYMNGYVYVRMAGHERSINNYVKRAVFVLEEKLGRKLLPGEISHHVNGIKDDDRPENLEPMNRKDHNAMHGKEMAGQNLVEYTCKAWGAKVADWPSSHRGFCSRRCSVAYNKPRLGTGANAKVVCRKCGKLFAVKPSRLSVAKYCSFDCSVEGRTTEAHA